MTATVQSPTHGGRGQPDAASNGQYTLQQEVPGPGEIQLCLLNGSNYRELSYLLEELAHEGQHRVVFDCSHVRRLGPVEIRTLVKFADQFAACDGYLRLIHVNPGIYRLLEIFHYLELLDNRCRTLAASHSSVLSRITPPAGSVTIIRRSMTPLEPTQPPQGCFSGVDRS